MSCWIFQACNSILPSNWTHSMLYFLDWFILCWLFCMIILLFLPMFWVTSFLCCRKPVRRVAEVSTGEFNSQPVSCGHHGWLSQDSSSLPRSYDRATLLLAGKSEGPCQPETTSGLFYCFRKKVYLTINVRRTPGSRDRVRLNPEELFCILTLLELPLLWGLYCTVCLS